MRLADQLYVVALTVCAAYVLSLPVRLWLGL